jgi:TonB family protein
MKRQACLLIIVNILLCSCLASAQTAFQIIVNEENSSASFTSRELSRIFLKKNRYWPDGTVAEPVDQAASSAVREAFSLSVHGRSVSSVKSSWQHQVFSGLSSPPVELVNDSEVVAYVRGHAGGVGYVSADARTDGVKVVELFTEPVRTHYVEPEYTEAARSSDVSGIVVLRVTVDRNGRVSKVNVTQPLPLGLSEQAVRAVQQWRYQPATRNGQPVEAEIDVQVRFKK